MKNIAKLVSVICASGVIHLAASNAEQWDKKITSKIDVDSFWLEVKKVREIKYGKDASWDKNMDYCSYWSEQIAKSKGDGLVMSKLIKYADKCMNTLNFMTKYMLDEGKEE